MSEETSSSLWDPWDMIYDLLAYGCCWSLSTTKGRIIETLFLVAPPGPNSDCARSSVNNIEMGGGGKQYLPDFLSVCVLTSPSGEKNQETPEKKYEAFENFYRIKTLIQGAFLIPIFPETILPMLQYLDLIRGNQKCRLWTVS